MNTPETTEEPPHFTWLERSADGLLFILCCGLALTALVVFQFRGGTLWNGLILVAGAGLTIAVGLAFGARLGRGYAGGMFMWWWMRLAFLLAVPFFLGVDVWLAFS